mmetsp:Transcript_25267/g.47779  ORF Transcript_25267/g.47779 Transcript_25267/m.47779 type:complete len:249 (-) Transcript_25267:176-922(-)
MKVTLFGTPHSTMFLMSPSVRVFIDKSSLPTICMMSSFPHSSAALLQTHTISVSVTDSTSMYTEVVSLPVKRYWPTKMMSPGLHSAGNLLLSMGKYMLLHGMLMSVVMVIMSSSLRMMGSGAPRSYSWNSCAKASLRSMSSSGPRVSSMVAHSLPVCFIAASRLRSVSLWYSWSPHEKSKRAMDMPAFSSSTSSATERDLLPTVQQTFDFVSTGTRSEIKIELRSSMEADPENANEVVEGKERILYLL